MSGAGPLPRPTARSIASGSYWQMVLGFSSFIPTFLICAVIYGALCLIAYQFDHRTIGTYFNSVTIPLEAKIISPIWWSDVILIPCWIWWHRFVWYGEKPSVWQVVFSKGGKNYAILISFILIITEIISTIHDSIQNKISESLILFLIGLINIVILLYIYYIAMPFFVKFAVGYEEDRQISLQRLQGNVLYLFRVFVLIAFPYIFLALVGQYYFDPYNDPSPLSAEIFIFILAAVSGSLWICATTLVFKWMVEGTGTGSAGPSPIRQG